MSRERERGKKDSFKTVPVSPSVFHPVSNSLSGNEFSVSPRQGWSMGSFPPTIEKLLDDSSICYGMCERKAAFKFYIPLNGTRFPNYSPTLTCWKSEKKWGMGFAVFSGAHFSPGEDWELNSRLVTRTQRERTQRRKEKKEIQFIFSPGWLPGCPVVGSGWVWLGLRGGGQ